MSLQPPHHALAIGSWRIDPAFAEDQPQHRFPTYARIIDDSGADIRRRAGYKHSQQRGFSSAGFADDCNQALSGLDAVMQIGQAFLMSRAQVKIAGIGGDAEGKLYKPKMFLIHRVFGFGTSGPKSHLLAGQI
jgi:hypothetical protein